jgi:hypothetical protein
LGTPNKERTTIDHSSMWLWLWWPKQLSVEISVLYRRLWRKSVICKNAAVKRWIYVWLFGCVIQWDSYSSCVKIRCQDTANGDCNPLRTLFFVCQWFVKCSHELWVCKWSWKLFTNPDPIYSQHTWDNL